MKRGHCRYIGKCDENSIKFVDVTVTVMQRSCYKNGRITVAFRKI